MGIFTPTHKTDIPSGPARTADNITPDNATNLATPLRQLDIETGGTISFVDGYDVVKSLTVPDGYALKCVVKRVNATGTTATGFIGYP